MIRLQIKRWLWASAMGLLLAVSIAAYLAARHGRDLADPAYARLHDRPIPVRCDLVAAQIIEDVVGATAVTVPSQVALLEVGASRSVTLNGPAAALAVKAVHVHEGDFVAKGQLLCEFEDQGYFDLLSEKAAAQDAAKALLHRVQEQLKYNQIVRELTLASAQEGIKYRTEDLDNRDKECEMFRKLSSTGAASLLQYYDARSRLFEARYALSEAKRNLQRTEDFVKVGMLSDKEELARAVSALTAARTDWELTRQEVERLKVRSPIDGFVTFDTGNYSPGAVRSAPGMGAAAVLEPVAGQIFAADKAIAQVLALDPIDVLVDYPLERIDDVRLGQVADVVLDNLPKETFSGRVLRIGPLVNSQVRVLPVFVRLDCRGSRIKPGITGFVRIRTRKEAKTAPATAVLHHNSKAVVFRVEDGRARLREVRTGHRLDNGVVEITDGLAPGDQVVVFQNFYRHADQLVSTDCCLRDNDPVDIQWKKWAGRE